MTFDNMLFTIQDVTPFLAKALFREITNKPVLSPMTLIGRIAREIVAVSTIKGSIGVAIQIPK